jgi:hypothetical protein
MNIFHEIRSLWRQHQRKLDLQILWPTCREKAKTLEEARMAFGIHAYHDPAWNELGDEHIARIIAELD